MPCIFEFDPENKLFRARLQGQITGAEAMEVYRTATALVPRVQPIASIWDMSEVTSLEVSADEVAALARTTPADPEPDRFRIIVAPSPLAFGVARMFQAKGEGTRPRVRVVHTLAEACAVVGVSTPHFQPLEES
jgi:hypothetical protein